MDQALRLSVYVASASPFRLFAALWGGLAVVDVARAAEASSGVQYGLLVVLAATDVAR